MELKRLTTCLITMVIVGPLMLAIAAEPAKEADQSKLRVGIFDSRAVACAWYRSKAHMKLVREKKAEHKKAEAAGDTKRVAELEKWGEGGQEAAHRQGFGNEPIDNVLERIEKDLPEIAESAGVDILVSKWEIAYQGKSAKFVDVTWEMVKLFDPDEATVEMLKELIKMEPIPADQLDHEHD